MKMRFLYFILMVGFLCSCSPASRLGLKKAFETTEDKFQDHTGFILYDLDQHKAVYEFNSAKYFTPASNTKIFTLYTALRILGDSVPALKYIQRNDSLIFWGTGDPSFLYQNTFDNGRVFDFLNHTTQNLYFSVSNFHTTLLGSGWTWDDYNDYYSAERSALPAYGNIFTAERTGSLLKIEPAYFEQFFSIGERKQKEEVIREIHSNNFQWHPGLSPLNSKAWSVPMKTSQQLTIDLLSDTLKRTIFGINMIQPPLAQPLYSIPTDSLYSVMMQDSDNFIAEQLLLMCADVVRDSLKTEIAITYSIENYLSDLPDKPIWVDGSGLSRYNLFTPRSIVKLWQKIYEAVPRERLFSLLATGGKTGTLKNWYKADKPYIFGKTGSLSNNHCLSGFLITKSGKTLIFSFMSNNFVTTTSEIRRNMQSILNNIYEKY